MSTSEIEELLGLSVETDEHDNPVVTRDRAIHAASSYYRKQTLGLYCLLRADGPQDDGLTLTQVAENRVREIADLKVAQGALGAILEEVSQIVGGDQDTPLLERLRALKDGGEDALLRKVLLCEGDERSTTEAALDLRNKLYQAGRY